LRAGIDGTKGLENQAEDKGYEERFIWASAVVAMTSLSWD
jgi:hypothetical protein